MKTDNLNFNDNTTPVGVDTSALPLVEEQAAYARELGNYTDVLSERVPFFADYEDSRISNFSEFQRKHATSTYNISEIPQETIDGFPVCVTRGTDGKLNATFTDNTHALIIGATRSGKTTGFVLPFLNLMTMKKNKPSIIISDPKKELYTQTAAKFEKNGYRIILLDFQDYTHSDCWNPLTKIYRTYMEYSNIESEITVVEIDGVLYNSFRGKVYHSQEELDLEIAEIKDNLYAEVDNMINSISQKIAPVEAAKDPYWDKQGCIVLQGFLWAMLEDTSPDTKRTMITEETYSFDTIIRIFDTFGDSGSCADNGYFTNRDIKTSKAYQLVGNSYIQMEAKQTKSCITSNFLGKIKKFRDTSVRRITCTNTFTMDSLDDDTPTVIYVSYKDEESLHYDTISLFISDLYTSLIGIARKNGGELSRPFYFLLDEFGNFPNFNSFENVISACGSRNIWFLLVVQSYAQLYRVYGKETAEIIIDNLNMHIFFGSNNYETKLAFSRECGMKCVFSPLSALNGTNKFIERYEKELVPLVPISKLAEIRDGECIVTQMRGDVLWSKIERSYTCPEFLKDYTKTEARKSPIVFCDPKYTYDIAWLVKPKRTSYTF